VEVPQVQLELKLFVQATMQLPLLADIFSQNELLKHAYFEDIPQIQLDK